MKTQINWSIFGILLTSSLLSVVCIFPYVLTLQAETLKNLTIPVETVFIAQLVQSSLLLSIAILFGLFFTHKIDFHLPILEALTQKRNFRSLLKSTVLNSAAIGVAIALTIYLTDALFTTFGATITTHQNYAPIWQKLLAAVYGGVAEEIIMRLFLMTFFIWIGMNLFKQSKPTRTGVIISIILAAVIFGLGHLPVTAALTELTALIVVRAIVLNGIGGVVFGYLFWKKGLESSILAHFTTDIFLLTLLPLIFT